MPKRKYLSRFSREYIPMYVWDNKVNKQNSKFHKTDFNFVGYLKIPNDMLLSLAEIGLSGSERQVLDVIMFNTIRMYTKEMVHTKCKLSISEIAQVAQLADRTVQYAMAALKMANIIDRLEDGWIGFNVHWDTWIPIDRRGKSVSLKNGAEWHIERTRHTTLKSESTG